jgi:hypothetical protein
MSRIIVIAAAGTLDESDLQEPFDRCIASPRGHPVPGARQSATALSPGRREQCGEHVSGGLQESAVVGFAADRPVQKRAIGERPERQQTHRHRDARRIRCATLGGDYSDALHERMTRHDARQVVAFEHEPSDEARECGVRSHRVQQLKQGFTGVVDVGGVRRDAFRHAVEGGTDELFS